MKRLYASTGIGGNATQRLMRKAGKAKRREVDPTTCDPDYDADQIEFMFAMLEYRHRNNRPFPTWSEALGVLKGLGYRK